jgi:hypothetical protein
MPQNYNTIAVNQIYVNESPLVFLAGETPIFNINWLGTGTLSSPVNTLYRKREDLSATKLTGSTTVSGRVQTTKQLTLDIPGDYELYVQVTDGSIVRKKAIRILVKKLGVD